MRQSAAGRTRTGKGVTSQQILSLLCLPFHHSGVGECLRRECSGKAECLNS